MLVAHLRTFALVTVGPFQMCVRVDFLTATFSTHTHSLSLSFFLFQVSRINTLPKLRDPASQAAREDDDARENKPHGNSGTTRSHLHPAHKSDSYIPRDSAPGGGGGGGGGRSGNRKGSFQQNQSDLPDLGLGMAATPAKSLDWKRANSKRRSFNL